MTYADFGMWFFFCSLIGCFTAFALSLRSAPDNRVLIFIYGAWISAVFAAHHLLVPNAAKEWHYLWYVWNMMVGAFPIVPAFMLKDAQARIPIIVFGALTVTLCGMYALASFLGDPLVGWWYFYGSVLFESAQVLSLILWSGPVIPIIAKAWNAITKNRSRPWAHRVSV